MMVENQFFQLQWNVCAVEVHPPATRYDWLFFYAFSYVHFYTNTKDQPEGGCLKVPKADQRVQESY
jgi:hypothetical protein